MLIDGRLIAQEIFDKLTGEIKAHKVKPHLAIILVGQDPVWQTYVKQKEKKAREIGAQTTLYQLPLDITSQKLIKLLEKLNKDPKIHGTILQRPLPTQIKHDELVLAIAPQKDVDGFHPKTEFPMPVAEAVMRILEEVYQIMADGRSTGAKPDRTSYSKALSKQWLISKKIVVVGKGETAGLPVITALQKLRIKPQVIDSKTKNPGSIIKKADIVISCVGREGIVKPKMLKKGVILIGVGLHKNPKGKLAGDYKESQIEKIASFYTPIPGGVGPINVACLMENLVKACYNTLA